MGYHLNCLGGAGKSGLIGSALLTDRFWLDFCAFSLVHLAGGRHFRVRPLGHKLQKDKDVICAVFFTPSSQSAVLPKVLTNIYMTE